MSILFINILDVLTERILFVLAHWSYSILQEGSTIIGSDWYIGNSGQMLLNYSTHRGGSNQTIISSDNG